MIEVVLYGTLRGRRAKTKDVWAPIAYAGDIIYLTGEQRHAGQHGRETIEIAIINGARYEINANEVPSEVW